MKEGLHPQYDAFFTSTLSTHRLLDWIYTKRPCSSYITLFFKNIFLPACFPLDNT